MRFTKPKKVIGLDIGNYAVKAIQMSRSGDTLVIDDVGYALVDRNLVTADPVAAQADALRQAIGRMPVTQALVVGALPGQTVVIRYPRLKKTGADHIDAAIEAEASHNIPYDLSEVFLDWSLLDEETEGNETNLKVLLVAAKHEIIDTRLQVADAAEVQYGVLSVDSLALADAAESAHMVSPEESAALINIGASSVSIHFTKEGSSNFIRDINWGAREMIQAIAKARRCDYDHAETMLFNYEEEMSKAGQAVATTVSQGSASPPPLNPSEGGSLLDPLDEELGALGEDPAGLAEAPVQDYEMESPLDEILAMPVSRLVAEVRRSFDYYEHQLYERPVERVILSGGPAHIPLIRQTLVEDLGVEDVTIANPVNGAIKVRRRAGIPEFEAHPAQFMVAIGLAARGVAEI